MKRLAIAVWLLACPNVLGDITTDLGTHYQSEQTSGTTLTAAVGNNGTLSGGRNFSNLTTSSKGGGLNLAHNYDGSADYSTATITGGIAYPFTLSCWYKPDDFDAISSPVAIHNSGDISQYIGLRVDSSTGALRVVRRVDPVNDLHSVGSTLTAGQWYHITVAFQSQTAYDVYVNGSLVGSFSGRDSVAVSSSFNTITVGGLRPSTWLADGPIDDVRYYTRAIVSGDNSELFYLGSPVRFVINSSRQRRN